MSKGGIIANVQPQFVPSDLPIIKSRVGEGVAAVEADLLIVEAEGFWKVLRVEGR